MPFAAVIFVHLGVVQISLPNLIVVAAMIAVFLAALLLPFPGGHDPTDLGADVGAAPSIAEDDHEH